MPATMKAALMPKEQAHPNPIPAPPLSCRSHPVSVTPTMPATVPNVLDRPVTMLACLGAMSRWLTAGARTASPMHPSPYPDTSTWLTFLESTCTQHACLHMSAWLTHSIPTAAQVPPCALPEKPARDRPWKRKVMPARASPDAPLRDVAISTTERLAPSMPAELSAWRAAATGQWAECTIRSPSQPLRSKQRCRGRAAWAARDVPRDTCDAGAGARASAGANRQAAAPS